MPVSIRVPLPSLVPTHAPPPQYKFDPFGNEPLSSGSSEAAETSVIRRHNFTPPASMELAPTHAITLTAVKVDDGFHHRQHHLCVFYSIDSYCYECTNIYFPDDDLKGL